MDNLLCRSFSKTDDPPPKLSFIPNCYFGKQAAQAWGTRDYSSEETWSNISLKSYQKSLNFGEPDYYKYFQCKDFVSRPTSSGVCHTFNALDLDDILKKSNWLTTFKSSFKQAPKKEILKSEGIESENGFLFSLGNGNFVIDIKQTVDFLTFSHYRHNAKLPPNLQSKVWRCSD